MAPKFIILGSGYSGSGAVLDYLVGRSDLANPLKSHELRIIQDPDGLIGLHNALAHGFYINAAASAMHRFARLCARLARPKRRFPPRPGGNYDALMPGFSDHADRFIRRITAANYGTMAAFEVLGMSSWKYLFTRSVLKFAGHRIVTRKAVPVTEAAFLDAAGQFLDAILAVGHDTSGVVVNQGGSYWTPVTSTRFYGDRRVIVVSRDPRDQYAELKQHKGIGDVDTFCTWYSALDSQIRRDEWQNPVVRHVKFEDFVRDFEGEKLGLDEFLGLPSDVPSPYRPDRSLPNVGKFHAVLTKDEIGVIENRLSGHIV